MSHCWFLFMVFVLFNVFTISTFYWMIIIIMFHTLPVWHSACSNITFASSKFNINWVTTRQRFDCSDSSIVVAQSDKYLSFQVQKTDFNDCKQKNDFTDLKSIDCDVRLKLVSKNSKKNFRHKSEHCTANALSILCEVL